MNDAFLRRAIELAFQSRVANADAVAKMIEFNEAQANWTAHCPKCGVSLKGTLKQIREHVCGPTG
jgi:hypothetical protein